MKLVVTKNVEEDKQILYLLDIEVDGKHVVKIGVTGRKIEERVVEILTSHFLSYRFFPFCRPKRFKRVDNAYEKEAILLNYFKDRKYISEKRFGGCTELVDVPLDEVVTIYEKLLRGEDLYENNK